MAVGVRSPFIWKTNTEKPKNIDETILSHLDINLITLSVLKIYVNYAVSPKNIPNQSTIAMKI